MVATKPRSVIHNDFSSLTAWRSGAAGFFPSPWSGELGWCSPTVESASQSGQLGLTSFDRQKSTTTYSSPYRLFPQCRPLHSSHSLPVLDLFPEVAQQGTIIVSQQQLH